MIPRILLIATLVFGAIGWLDIFKASSLNAPSAPAARGVNGVQAIDQQRPEQEAMPRAALADSSKVVLGPTVVTTVADSGLDFVARVDTGAQTCSIHAEEISIADASQVMEENIGKTIRFRTANRRGESAWLERPIEDVRWIKTSEQGEWRYIVPLTLSCAGMEKEVLVSLNQRSHMDHALLVGRNLLAGAFLVDVER